MIHRLDVDRGDVIGQQRDLVGVDFVAKLVLHLFGRDQAGLQQPRYEGAGAGKGVDDVAELGLQHLVHRMDDEIHDLDRSVDDAQLFGGAGEGAAGLCVGVLQ